MRTRSPAASAEIFRRRFRRRRRLRAPAPEGAAEVRRAAAAVEAAAEVGEMGSRLLQVRTPFGECVNIMEHAFRGAVPPFPKNCHPSVAKRGRGICGSPAANPARGNRKSFARVRSLCGLTSLRMTIQRVDARNHLLLV